ncbi:DUF6286 domain-containing protein [Micromonospora sp. CPCC 206061]|uniref:DUF6286 domain-containing protein n=1 Tax=Micromonospora sp. CPCC 206061 TaxID=3122410 RepID=UPI002FF0D536
MRNVNRLMAFVLSLAVIVAGVTVVVEVIAERAGAGPAMLDWPALYRWAQRTTWGAAPVRLISCLLALGGLALLLAQLAPRRPDRLALHSDDTATDAAVSRRGLTRAVRSAVTSVDGIADARVKIRRRRIQVRARTPMSEPSHIAEVRDTTTVAARQRVDSLTLEKPPALSVRVSPKER